MSSATSAPRAAATEAARSRLRFQISTRSIDGRTARCAATRWGASPPAPTMRRARLSVRERKREPSAESHAVFR